MISVLVTIKTEALGDNIGAIPCIEEWRRQTNNQVWVKSKWSNILKGSYPNLIWLDEIDSTQIWDQQIELDYRFDLPLQLGFAEQLGLKDWKYTRPRVDSFRKDRPVKSKYVTLSIQSTAQCKYWNYPDGWNILSKSLRKLGITPVCIDQYESFGINDNWNLAPTSAVRRLNNPIEETINYIEHAEFHIGISSGISWVAHGLGKKVVMISGVTSEDNEFKEDCLRIMNTSVCHGCINQPEKYKFAPDDWLWCPVNRGTQKQFECTKTISPSQVIDKLIAENWV